MKKSIININKWNGEIIYDNNNGEIYKINKPKYILNKYPSMCKKTIIDDNILYHIAKYSIILYRNPRSPITSIGSNGVIIDSVIFNDYLICIDKHDGFIFLTVYKPDLKNELKIRKILSKVISYKILPIFVCSFLNRTEKSLIIFINKKEYIIRFKYNINGLINDIYLKETGGSIFDTNHMIKKNDMVFYCYDDNIQILSNSSYKIIMLKEDIIHDIIKNDYSINIYKDDIIYATNNDICILNNGKPILLKHNVHKITCLNVIDEKLYYGDEEGNIYSYFNMTKTNYKYWNDNHKLIAYILKKYLVSDVIFEIFKYL